MAGGSAAYIGAPPPHLRKRKQRDPSPTVPSPVESTPARRDAFGVTPSRSARVYKTYAHKRARSYASSSAGDGPDVAEEEESSSSSSSAEESPIKVKYGVPARQITALSKRSLDEHVPEHNEGPGTALVAVLNDRHRESNDFSAAAVSIPGLSESALHRPLPRRQSAVYVEVPSLGPGARIGPPRGLRGNPKPTTAMPSPPPTSDDNTAPSDVQFRASSAAHLSLSDALNNSFANTSVAPFRPAHALPAEPSSAPPKRKRGRPPGKGNSLSGLGPIISQGAPGSSPIRKSAAVPTASTPTAVISAPVKRGPGRPRKHPLPVPSGSTPARPPLSAGPVSSSKKPKSKAALVNEDDDEGDSSEAEAVAEQLLQDVSHSLERVPTSSRHREKYAYQSVDVSNIARALERQAADEEGNPTDTGHIPPPEGPPPKKPRGRPRGSKNKSTLEREAEARERRLASLSSPPTRTVAAFDTSASTSAGAGPSFAPVPIKRPRGRPRKSAPSASSLEYFEPIRDFDGDTPMAGPSTPAPKRRGRSRTRANSVSAVSHSPPTPAAPPTPSPYYLDLNTMQWRRRTRSASALSTRRRSSALILAAAGEAGEVTEYQTIKALCVALKAALSAAAPKLAQVPVQTSATRKGKSRERGRSKGPADDGLKVAPSGVLFVADDGDDNPATGAYVFRGSWSVLGDPHVALDDGLALKKLHEVVLGLGACVTRLDQTEFSRDADGRTVTVSVPCCCVSTKSDAADVAECEGEMAVSVAEGPVTRDFLGIAKALRMTVIVVH
ncbi:hypothetical protein TRAPUB_11838 [Trametes pubescens]|uniref:Uncharacterized protein n=1 Tax=Trametes pubescens TaxID=154538 RepID=A0A1M2VVP9_TRAPU|nr:hypothetical protein TRAPUB_11838 [Trametes pubescens]